MRQTDKPHDMPAAAPGPVRAASRRLGFRLAGATLLVALAATFSWTALAGGRDGGGEGRPSCAAGGAGMAGPGLPMLGGRHLERLLDRVDATQAQRTQIRQIAEGAARDLRALHEGGGRLHERALEALTAPKVDAAAAEKLRQQMLAQHDRASKRITQALLDTARVLTPEQRAKLGQEIKAHRAGRDARMKQRWGGHGGACGFEGREPLAGGSGASAAPGAPGGMPDGPAAPPAPVPAMPPASAASRL